MPSSLWSPGKSSSDREAVHFIFPTCYSRPATTSTLYPSIRDCNRALYLSVFAFAAALCMRLQNGNTNSHEREREKVSSRSRSPSHAISYCRHTPFLPVIIPLTSPPASRVYPFSRVYPRAIDQRLLCSRRVSGTLLPEPGFRINNSIFLRTKSIYIYSPPEIFSAA